MMATTPTITPSKKEMCRKALEMRNAIDMIEGALMGLGNFVDLPAVFENARPELILAPPVKLGEVRRVCTALEECTRIINSDEYSPDQFGYREPAPG